MPQYFDNDENIKSKVTFFNYEFEGETYTFKSDNGVFSKNELDMGTLFFLNTLKDEPISGKVLDLGCGIGCLVITLARLFPKCNAEGVEINKRALELCNENIKLNKVTNVQVYESNICDKVEGKYDVVVTNPPIRAGKEVIYEFYKQAYEHLSIKGYLYIVIRKSHGAETSKKKIEEIFGNCEVLKKKKGIYVLKAIRY